MDPKKIALITVLLFIIIFPVLAFAGDEPTVFPADNATDVPLDTDVHIEFPYEMLWCTSAADDGLDAVSLTLVSSQHTVVVPGTEAISTVCHTVIGGGQLGTITFSLDDPGDVLRAGLTYAATLSGAKDKDGVTVADVTWSFETRFTGPPVQIGSFSHQKAFGEVTLDATGKFYDPDGGSLSYDWVYFLRGSILGGSGTASGISVTLQDLLPGFYDIIVQVTDDDDDSVQAGFVVFVDIGPVGDFDGDGVTDGQDLEIFANAFGR